MSRLAVGPTCPAVVCVLRAVSLGASCWLMSTHLHLVLQLSMCGAIQPLPYVVMACTRQLYVYIRVLSLLNLKSILVNKISTNAFASAFVGIVLITILMHGMDNIKSVLVVYLHINKRNYFSDYPNGMKSDRWWGCWCSCFHYFPCTPASSDI